MSLDILEKAINYGRERGAEFIDIRYQEVLYELIVIDNGVVRSYDTSIVKGLGVRVLVDKTIGYSATNRLDFESVKDSIDKAIKIARSARKYSALVEILKRRTFRDRIVSHYSIDPLEVDPSNKLEVLMDTYRSTKEVNGIVSSVVRYGFERDYRVYVSSNGDFIEQTISLIGLSTFLVARVENVMERLHDQKSSVAGWEFIKGMDYVKFGRENAELVVEATKAPVVKPGKYTVVLDNEMVGLMLHEAFGHATEADIVESGGSVLERRIGEKIASELVTVIDDGRVEGGYYLPYDDEGTPKTKTITVEKGVLKTYLHSLETAIRLGGEPTGNARVMYYEHPILIRQTNTYMAPGDWKPEEIIRDTREGIYVRGRGAMGGQVDTSMGTFTFTAGPSYLVKNGELAQLVRGVMLSGNILDTLKNVDAVGRDLVVTTSVFGGCGKAYQRARVGDGGPHVRVREIILGGGGYT
ncbi:MAG: TldD/PmbA family protein [Desulfurococcaceae archaeon]|uniref:TldD/PmbA family protein n=2 Tax=Staphylothermus marinus TaxID=2280 RepID=A0A7C4D925_STAMA